MVCMILGDERYSESRQNVTHRTFDRAMFYYSLFSRAFKRCRSTYWEECAHAGMQQAQEPLNGAAASFAIKRGLCSKSSSNGCAEKAGVAIERAPHDATRPCTSRSKARAKEAMLRIVTSIVMPPRLTLVDRRRKVTPRRIRRSLIQALWRKIA